MKRLLLVIQILFLVLISRAQWTSQATGFLNPVAGVMDICVIDSNVVWAIPYDGSGMGLQSSEFTKTINSGATWVNGQIVTSDVANIQSICALDANTAWATLYSGAAASRGVFKTIDGGTSWTHQGAGVIFAGVTSWPAFVYFKDVNNGVAVGDPESGYFEIYTTTDGGTSWTRTPQLNIPSIVIGEYSYTNAYHAIGNTIWFGSYLGKVFKSVDFGLNWTASTVIAAANTGVEDVYFINVNDGIAKWINRSSNVYGYKTTNDGGLTWTNVTPVGIWYKDDFDGPPNSATYVSTGNLGSSYSVDGGITWISIDTGTLRTKQGWANGTTGWCGGFTVDSLTDGIYKYSGGISLGFEALNRNNARMRVYPNPTKGNFNIQIGGAEFNDAELFITDIVGHIVYSSRLENTSYLIEANLDLSFVSKGLYFVNVLNGSTKFSQKLIIE